MHPLVSSARRCWTLAVPLEIVASRIRILCGRFRLHGSMHVTSCVTRRSIDRCLRIRRGFGGSLRGRSKTLTQQISDRALSSQHAFGKYEMPFKAPSVSNIVLSYCAYFWFGIVLGAGSLSCIECRFICVFLLDFILCSFECFGLGYPSSSLDLGPRS